MQHPTIHSGTDQGGRPQKGGAFKPKGNGKFQPRRPAFIAEEFDEGLGDPEVFEADDVEYCIFTYQEEEAEDGFVAVDWYGDGGGTDILGLVRQRSQSLSKAHVEQPRRCHQWQMHSLGEGLPRGSCQARGDKEDD